MITEPTRELEDDTLSSVSGGGKELVGKKVHVDGELYLDSYKSASCGNIRGDFTVQMNKAGRPAEYLLKTNIGWVEASSLTR